MECGHRICENCFRVFGEPDPDPFLCTADMCFLCQTESRVAVRVRAPTAGVGILCVDGGGVKAAIPATILERLEKQIDLPIPVQEHFQLALGTSAGKLPVRSWDYY